MNNQDQLNDHLDRSCELINTKLEQQLNARMSLAKSRSKNSRFLVGYALAPLALVVTLWLNTINDPELSEEDIQLYEDLELIIAEGELDFLDTMDVSDWLDEVPESTKS